MTDWPDLAASLAVEFGARAAEVDAAGRFPTENVERLGETGYLRMSLDTASAPGADLDTVCAAQRALARGCASTALAVNMHLFAVGFHAEAARRAPGPPTSVLRQAARGRLVGGTFASSLADGPDDAVTARPIQGGYVVRGRRPFCSLAPCLDLCFCSALVVTGDDPDPSAPGGPAPEIIAFWLPRRTRGLWFDDTWDTLGMRGTGSFDVVLDDVVVPAGLAAPMPAPDAGWNAEAERAQAWFTLTISAVYLGLAEEAAAVAIGAAGGRLGRAPGARRLVGEIGVELGTASALLADALRRRRGGPLAQADLALAKFGVTQASAAVGSRGLALVGGRSLSRRLVLERHFRDLQAGRFHPPSDERALELIGAAMLAAPTGDRT